MSKLTKRAVDALETPKQGQIFLWDSELRGFGVRALPSGLKTFVLQYRNAEGRSRRLVIGRYGVLTVEQAWDKAKINLGAVADGGDPTEEAAPRETITVAEVCDWYLAEAEAGRILGRRSHPIKPSALAMDRSRIDTHIKPLLGRRQVRALKAADISSMQADIAAGETAKPRDPIAAESLPAGQASLPEPSRHSRASWPTLSDRTGGGVGLWRFSAGV
jgi:hypothetical protein